MSLAKRKKHRVTCREHPWFDRIWNEQAVASKDWQDHNREFHGGKLVALISQYWG